MERNSNQHHQDHQTTTSMAILDREEDDDSDTNCPDHFKCPISMELMKDPVTISTGVTYDRQNIEKWLLTYKNTTCPATMQPLSSPVITPNHTLQRLIVSWLRSKHGNDFQSPSLSVDELFSLLDEIESSPFKVTRLKKLRSVVGPDGVVCKELVRLGAVELLVNIVAEISVVGDFESLELISTVLACEEGVAVLYQLCLSEFDGKEEELLVELLLRCETIVSLTIILQKGSSEARFHSVSILRRIVKSGRLDLNLLSTQESEGVDLFKSLLELVSDDICTKASTFALEVLIELMGSSKRNRVKGIEAGAICVLIELLPDSSRSKTEKILYLIKQLCECAEGRDAFVEHAMGIAAVSKKLLHVSTVSTKIAVRIIWLLSTFHPTEQTLEELLMSGSVKKLVVLMHLNGRSSTKDKVVEILKAHGNLWSRYPCFSMELKQYLGLVN